MGGGRQAVFGTTPSRVDFTHLWTARADSAMATMASHRAEWRSGGMGNEAYGGRTSEDTHGDGHDLRNDHASAIPPCGQ